jgi:hypothetical protein
MPPVPLMVNGLFAMLTELLKLVPPLTVRDPSILVFTLIDAFCRVTSFRVVMPSTFNVPFTDVFAKTALDPTFNVDPTVKVGKIMLEETYRLPVTLTLPPTLTLFKTDKLVVETLIRVARPAT